MIKWNKSTEKLPCYNSPIMIYHIFDIFYPIDYPEILCGYSLGMHQIIDPNCRYTNHIKIDYPDIHESKIREKYISDYLCSYSFIVSQYNKRGYFYWTYYNNNYFNTLFNKEKLLFYNDVIHKDLTNQLEKITIKFNREINIRRALE